MSEQPYLSIRNAPAPNFTDHSNTLILTAGVANSITVPDGYYLAFFTTDTDFWATIGGTASIPTVDITDGTSPELNPVLRRVSPGDVISVISATDAKVQVSFYKDRSN